ncbi:hypothetical protein IL306_006183 [Fusarium sp. DS 682]|nr:hypothetical protein IL306_006183 [Fusarium sp. DS 682]
MGYWLEDEVVMILSSFGKVQQTLNYLRDRYPGLAKSESQTGGPLYPTQDVIDGLLFDLCDATMRLRGLSVFQPYDECYEPVVLSLNTTAKDLKGEVYALRVDIWKNDSDRPLKDMDGTRHLNPWSLLLW